MPPRDEAESKPSEPQGKVDFSPPEGWKPSGTSGTAEVKWVLKDGLVCLTEFDGHELPGYEDEAKEAKERNMHPEDELDNLETE